MSEFLFDNVEEALKKVAKICFYILLVVGVGMVVIGFFKVIAQCDGGYPTFGEVMAYTLEDYAYGLSKGYDWYVEGYKGKTMMSTGFYMAIASLSALPMYGFGVLIEEIKNIRKLQEKKNTEN